MPIGKRDTLVVMVLIKNLSMMKEIRWKDMKIAITGGAGFIGSHVASMYLDAGHDVMIIDTPAALSDNAHGHIDARARVFALDIRDEKLRALLQHERPDVVSHHAAQAMQAVLPVPQQPMPDADIHVRGLLNVLEGCVAASVSQVIFASGGNSLYGCAGVTAEGEIATVTEESALCPRSPHDISNVAGEWYVRYYAQHYGFKHTIVRYADVYGDTREEFARHPLDYFTHTLLTGRNPILRGALDEMHDHIFIDDVARANLAVLERGYNQTFHISTGTGYTVRELYDAVAQHLESDSEPTCISNALVRPHSLVMDNAKARTLLRWQPEVTLETGIEQLVKRIRERDGQYIVPTHTLSLVGAV